PFPPRQPRRLFAPGEPQPAARRRRGLARARALERGRLRPAPGDRTVGRRQAADRQLRLVAGRRRAAGPAPGRGGLDAVGRGGEDGRRFVPFAVRFHLAPQVSALVARDRHSVLLKAEGQETGWWLRYDALEVALEPSAQYADGQIRHGEQIVLRGQARLDAG